MYIWHKEAKSTKFHVRDGEEGTAHYVSKADGLCFPMSEYEPCPPPSEWKDVTSACRLSPDGCTVERLEGERPSVVVAGTYRGFRFVEMMVPLNALPLDYRPFAIYTLEKVYRIEEERPLAS